MTTPLNNNTQPQGNRYPPQYRLREQQQPPLANDKEESKQHDIHSKKVTFNETPMEWSHDHNHSQQLTHTTHNIPRTENTATQQQQYPLHTSERHQKGRSDDANKQTARQSAHKVPHVPLYKKREGPPRVDPTNTERSSKAHHHNPNPRHLKCQTPSSNTIGGQPPMTKDTEESKQKAAAPPSIEHPKE